MNESQPSLRLFLSADLAGSTAFKQSSKLDEWQEFFREFYRQLPALVKKQWIGCNLGQPELKTWKLIGDEIVFSLPLTNSAQIHPTISAFRAAVSNYRRRVITTSKSKLDVKCAGWTAGFPVGNIIVESFGELPEDYIGPGMDIGFRLVKAATPRRMLISTELAWLLTLNPVSSLRFYVGEGLDLKGVARGKTYPCIWLDNFRDTQQRSPDDQLTLEEEALRDSKPRPCDDRKLHQFCDRWLRNMGLPFVVPFISEDPALCKPQPDYPKWLSQVNEQDSQGTQTTKEPPRKTSATTTDEIVSSLQAAIKDIGQPTGPRKRHRRRK